MHSLQGDGTLCATLESWFARVINKSVCLFCWLRVLLFRRKKTSKAPFYSIIMVTNILKILLMLRLAQATIPDCSSSPGNLSYFKEDCFNSTHRRVQSGKCVNGELLEESVSLLSCSDYVPQVPSDEDVLVSTKNHYCHSCQDHRVICSELDLHPQACAARENDLTNCRQVESVTSFSGCLSASNFYTAIEYCKSDRTSDAYITSHSCAEEYGSDFYRCMSCHDGLRVCAGTDAMDCEEIGLPSPTANGDATGDGESNGEGDNAVDGHDEYGSFDCGQFWGDVQFYKEECFNQTHRVVTSGICLQGEIQGLSFEKTSCMEDGEDMAYCHDCDGRAVCANTPIKFNLCDDNDEIRGCSTYYDRSSHWAGCADEVRATKELGWVMPSESEKF